MTEDEAAEVIERVAEGLMEHFEHVRVFVGYRPEPERCIALTSGFGMWEAQWGQIEAWVRERKAYEQGYHAEEGRRAFCECHDDEEEEDAEQ